MKILSKTVKIAMFAPFAWVALVPLTILSFTRFSAASLDDARLYLGLALIVIGASFCAAVGILFARLPHFGKSTLFRDSPDLVVSGPFAYVRNPMPLGVFMIIAGEAFLFGSLWVGAWGVLFLIAEHFYLKRVEEPSLAARFGHGYLEYYRNVPRWFPRSTPWKPSILP